MKIKIVKHKSLVILYILLSVTIVLFVVKYQWANSASDVSGAQSWPSEIVQIEYFSAVDNTAQPALFYKPDVSSSSPLLVALHTWSGDYLQSSGISYAEWCIKKGWIFIHPNFRGPNNRPEATGSDLVIQDILDAVEYAKNNSNVDSKRIYLVGASGGGYTALLVAAKHPDIWAGVSVWSPITDLSAWYFQSKQTNTEYAEDIVKSLGGPPGSSPAVDLSYKNRSPITYLSTLISAPIDINAGFIDGRVPISHSLLAYNALVSPEYQLSEDDMQYFVEYVHVPPYLVDPFLSDPSYGKKTPAFRRQSEDARLTIFNGGHEIIFNAALMWLEKQQK